MSSAQNAVHTINGINKGKNILSDCCAKIATTLNKPKINPIPLTNVIEAFLSVFCSSIFVIGFPNVYDSMFLQLQKVIKKYAPCGHIFHERTSRFLDRTCELGHVVSTKHIHCKIQRTDHDGNHSEHCIECIRVGRLSVESHVVFNAFGT